MAFRRLFLFAPLLLSACASMPDFQDESPRALSKLSHDIECQIQEVFETILKSNPPDKKFSPKEINFREWAVSYTITTKAKRTNSASVDPLRWVVPSALNSLVFKAGAGVSSVAERTGTAQFGLNIDKLDELDCSDVNITSEMKRELRLEQWVTAVHQTEGISGGFGYTTDVDLEFAGDVGLDIADERVSGTGGVAARKSFNNIVDFAFSKRPEPPRPQEVIVVSLPDGRTARQTTPRRPAAARSSPQRSRTVYDVSPGAVNQNNQILQQLQLERIDRTR